MAGHLPGCKFPESSLVWPDPTQKEVPGWVWPRETTLSHCNFSPSFFHIFISFPMTLTRLRSEEVGHTYGPARNSVSRMVSKHCKINVMTVLKVHFCTCPVAETRTCRSTILGSQIVEVRPYCSRISVVLVVMTSQQE